MSLLIGGTLNMDLCGEGDVTPVNPVVPDEDEDGDIDYDEEGNIIKN